MSLPRVAIYGLGNMGFPLAERIGRRFPTQVSGLDPARVGCAQAAFGAAPVQDPADLAQTPALVLCLPAPAASRSVLQAVAPHLPRGAVMVETSTVNPEHIHAPPPCWTRTASRSSTRRSSRG